MNMAVYKLKRNDVSAAVILIKSGKLSTEENEMVVMLQDDPAKLFAALNKKKKTKK